MRIEASAPAMGADVDVDRARSALRADGTRETRFGEVIILHERGNTLTFGVKIVDTLVAFFDEHRGDGATISFATFKNRAGSLLLRVGYGELGELDVPGKEFLVESSYGIDFYRAGNAVYLDIELGDDAKRLQKMLYDFAGGRGTSKLSVNTKHGVLILDYKRMLYDPAYV